MPGDITLCFGLAVTNDSLTFATMAYEELKGPFRFVQLVQDRIRRGDLQAEQGCAVAHLPNEIWELIRHKVTEIELEAAERTQMLRDYNLDLPSTSVLPQDIAESRRASGDPTAAVILALPRNPAPVNVDPYNHPSCYLPEVSEDEPYADGLWNISLETPARASERFRKLVNDLHLVPLVINDGTIGLPHKLENKRVYKEVDPRQIKPRWMLFTTLFFDQS